MHGWVSFVKKDKAPYGTLLCFMLSKNKNKEPLFLVLTLLGDARNCKKNNKTYVGNDEHKTFDILVIKIL